MTEELSASIIISNYNYERYLNQAIDSALGQTYRNVEVIVVDDGSTDHSREIIRSYGDKIISVFKPNGGQASAWNAGFSKSKGDVILFLDSDDFLYPEAMQLIMDLFSTKKMAKVHWPLTVIDENGMKTDATIPVVELPEGDFRQHALKNGPPFFLNPPTSGNAWSRNFIQSVMPIPEIDFKIGADTYLFELVAFFGFVSHVRETLGVYRIHSRNNYSNRLFNDKLLTEIQFYEALFPIMKRYCDRLGLNGDPKLWRDKSWFHCLSIALQDIRNNIPPGSSMILIDDSTWNIGDSYDGREILIFSDWEGDYAGSPVDDASAIAELERLREKGVDYLVLAWGSFWWLEYYPEFIRYLRLHTKCILENQVLIIFDLAGSS